MQSVEVSEDMNSSTSVEMSRLEEPQVKTCKVAEWKTEFCCGSLLKIKCLKLSYLGRVLRIAR
jgi:hypothetical protein